MATTKFDDDARGAAERFHRMTQFQTIHNELRKDFSELQNITSERIDKGRECPELIRSCLRELFALIEADVFYLNSIEPYDGYSDDDWFINRFKETYKNHCRIHNASDLYRKFADHHLGEFNRLKEKRDSITHPKSSEDLKVDARLFNDTTKMFKNYTDFLSSTMTDVFVSFKGSKLTEFLSALQELQDKH